MADIDLKTLTPDTSLPTTGFLFGADSQASASPSVYSTQTVATTLLGSTSLTGATITADAPVLNLAQTWNASGVTFTGLKFNAAGSSDANSAAGSLLMDLQVGGSSRFQVRKDGRFGGSSDNIISVGGRLDFTASNLVSASLNAANFNLSAATLSFTSSSGGANSGDLILGRRAAANLRLGAADVGATTSTVTITIAAPGVVTWTGHTLSTGTPVVFTTTGALPTGITAGTTYYAVVVDANTFQIASSVANAIATPATVITTSGTQSGTHTGTRYNITQRLGMQSVTGVSDRLGADLLIQGSQGTGTGAGGSIVFQVAPAGTTGTAQNALATALTIDSTRKITFADAGAQAYIDSIGKASFYSGRFTAGSGFANPWVTIADNTLGVNLADAAFLSWCNSGGAATGTADVRLYRDTSNTLALRNGANANIFRVYRTTDGTNGSWLEFDANANGNAYIGTNKSGTGSGGPLYFTTGGTARWYIDANGHFLGSTDNTYDIGASGANRPRHVYVAGRVELDRANSEVNGPYVGIRRNTNGGLIRCYLSADAAIDGNLVLTNSSLTDFGRLQFGGTTSSFPALKRSSTALETKLADDSAYAPHAMQYLDVTDGVTAPASATGRARIYVDTADGDLKVIFADGTVKTIVTDT